MVHGTGSRFGAAELSSPLFNHPVLRSALLRLGPAAGDTLREILIPVAVFAVVALFVRVDWSWHPLHPVPRSGAGSWPHAHLPESSSLRAFATIGTGFDLFQFRR
jgi:hypothetical protein